MVALVKPVTDAMQRARVSRNGAALLTLLGVLAVVAGLITLVSTQIASGFPELQRQAEAGLGQVQEWLARPPLRLSTHDLTQYLNRARENLTSRQSTVVSGALARPRPRATWSPGSSSRCSPRSSSSPTARRSGAGWCGCSRAPPARLVDGSGRLGWVTLTSFVRATVIVALVDAMGIGVGAVPVLHVPLAVPLGVLVFLSAFIPIGGTLFSGAVAVLVALVAQGPVTALIMMAVVLVVQQIESHGLQPFLMGRAVRVHPLAVILAIAAGATIGGIVGPCSPCR